MSKKNVLVTGGAGFIGSNLVEALVSDERVGKVRVMDNLATGHLKNLQAVWHHPKFEFIEGDIREYEMCRKAMEGMHLVSHQAALGSVPRSITDPLTSNAVNITGTLNIFVAAKETNIERVVYAASSSTYGDHPTLPKVEEHIGKPLSPYAVTKYVNELYADVFHRTYQLNSIGLRYFNVFGYKQDPDNPYAAVIPIFFKAVLKGTPPTIYGDGETSRDFTFVTNAVQANLKALFTENPQALNQVYNVACGQRTTLTQLFYLICEALGREMKPIYGPERKGDIKHSLADISKAEKLLGYKPTVSVREGILKAAEWYKSLYA
ncbi:MAG: SDR family oxidoreductase [Flammeovirgaceae bacterium]|nr:SDR family oxidoreductase [Flammeovirgaceae bacterium]MDW8286570.1 SDR family oxidoreductase [Flammeovirgaceae bacterium]